MKSINEPLSSIQLVQCSFPSTLLSHGLDKLIVKHFILIRVVNLCFPGQIKCLTGYTAKPQFLSQITVDILFLFYFKEFIFLLLYSVVGLPSFTSHRKNRNCSCISLWYLLSCWSSYRFAGYNAGERSTWHCWRTSTENRKIAGSWTGMKAICCYSF